MADVSLLKDRLEVLTADYNQRLGEAVRVRQQLAQVVARMGGFERSVLVGTTVRTVLEILSKATEGGIKAYVEPLITEALQAVFGYDLRFGLSFEFERNQLSVVFSLTDGSGNSATGELEDMKGGGVLDVVSIVLQFALVELFGLDGPIILDEPGKFVDPAHQVTLGQLILSFSEKFARQIVIVTHDDGICAIGTRHYHVALGGDGLSHVMLVQEGS